MEADTGHDTESHQVTTATSCQGNDIDRASNRGDQLRPAFVALLITL